LVLVFGQSKEKIVPMVSFAANANNYSWQANLLGRGLL
jgi:hypothetical protein